MFRNHNLRLLERSGVVVVVVVVGIFDGRGGWERICKLGHSYFEPSKLIAFYFVKNCP